MPREVVHTDGPFHVKVGWSPERGVQVGVELDDDRPLIWQLYGDDDVLAFIGGQVYDAVEAHRATSNGSALNINSTELGRIVVDIMASHTRTFHGVWADMSREACNRLVRLVRKARDSAFGADA